MSCLVGIPYIKVTAVLSLLSCDARRLVSSLSCSTPESEEEVHRRSHRESCQWQCRDRGSNSCRAAERRMSHEAVACRRSVASSASKLSCKSSHVSCVPDDECAVVAQSPSTCGLWTVASHSGRASMPRRRPTVSCAGMTQRATTELQRFCRPRPLARHRESFCKCVECPQARPEQQEVVDVRRFVSAGCMAPCAGPCWHPPDADRGLVVGEAEGKHARGVVQRFTVALALHGLVVRGCVWPFARFRCGLELDFVLCLTCAPAL